MSINDMARNVLAPKIIAGEFDVDLRAGRARPKHLLAGFN